MQEFTTLHDVTQAMDRENICFMSFTTPVEGVRDTYEVCFWGDRQQSYGDPLPSMGEAVASALEAFKIERDAKGAHIARVTPQKPMPPRGANPVTEDVTDDPLKDLLG